MNAVWLVRSRQIASRLRFWIAIVGYNPRDSSLGQSIYLIYVVVFFSLWGFAVLALLADFGAGILSLFKAVQPSFAATTIITFILIVDALLRGYRSTKQSPFIFSDDDAGLICQTPVDRRYVAIAWMVSDWVTATLPFVALAVVLGFANIQLIEMGGIQWRHLPRYWLAQLQVASIILPIHLALTALGYALGALRLRRDWENPGLRLIPVGLIAVLFSLVLFHQSGLQPFLWPVQFPIRAALGDSNWLVGFCVAVLFAIIGLFVLFWSSPGLSLSRAAQESRLKWVQQQANWSGDSRISQQMKIRQRLGAGHPSSYIPGGSGIWALIWKDWVITLRSMNLIQVLTWIGIFIASLGMMLPVGGGAQLWAFIIWGLLISQRGTQRLRSDLDQWLIIRQLPFSARDMLIPEIARPVVAVTLLGWLAYGVSAWLGYIPQPAIFLLIPTACFCFVLAATYDVFRQCRGADLLTGKVAEMGIGGLLLGIVLAGTPLALVSLVASQFPSAWINWLVGIIGLAITSGITYGLWLLTVSKFDNLQ